MGKTLGTIAKVAAVVAVAYFAPAVAAKVGAATLGKAAAAKVMASALGSTVASAAAGAAMGAAGGAIGIPGLNAGSGALAGGVGGSGLFGSPSTTFKGAAQNLGAKFGIGSNTAALNPVSVAPTGVTGSLGATLPGTTLAAAPVTGLTASGAVAGLGATGLGAGLKSVAPSLLAAGLVGSGMTAQMQAQQAELEKARQANAAFTQERFNQAQRLLGEADYFNPEYMGRQAGQAALIRGSIQESEATRGLTGARLAAEQRRFRLGTARNVGTAFQQGFGGGVDARIKTRAAGLSSIPASYPTTTEEGLSLEQARLKAREAERKGVGLVLGQVLGVPPLEQAAGG